MFPRAQKLVEQHGQLIHYLVVSTDGDKDIQLAKNIQSLLKSEDGVTVAGYWNLTPGEMILDAWQRLSETSMVVLVILSSDLFKNHMLELLLPELLSDHRRQPTVPLFLEPVDEQIPHHLSSLKHRWGRRVYEETWNIESFVKDLKLKYDTIKHLECEVSKLRGMVENIRHNPSVYVYPCEESDC